MLAAEAPGVWEALEGVEPECGAELVAGFEPVAELTAGAELAALSVPLAFS